jgi:hypothetical protein
MLPITSIANAFRNIGRFFESIGIGIRSASIAVMSGGVQAFNAVTFSSFVATNTVTINGTVMTGRASPTLAADFAIGASDTITATNLAAVINGTRTLSGVITPAPAKINGVVYATSSGAVVTITFFEPGTIGLLGTLAISANGSVTGANFAGGTEGTITLLNKGL